MVLPERNGINSDTTTSDSLYSFALASGNALVIRTSMMASMGGSLSGQLKKDTYG
jgi:hypothetical protein